MGSEEHYRKYTRLDLKRSVLGIGILSFPECRDLLKRESWKGGGGGREREGRERAHPSMMINTVTERYTLNMTRRRRVIKDNLQVNVHV